MSENGGGWQEGNVEQKGERGVRRWKEEKDAFFFCKMDGERGYEYQYILCGADSVCSSMYMSKKRILNRKLNFPKKKKDNSTYFVLTCPGLGSPYIEPKQLC